MAKRGNKSEQSPARNKITRSCLKEGGLTQIQTELLQTGNGDGTKRKTILSALFYLFVALGDKVKDTEHPPLKERQIQVRSRKSKAVKS